MHWKIARDPFLGPLAAELGEKVAWDAGFFLDTNPSDAPLDDVDWLCTPLPPRRAPGARPIALVATGGFCPIHAGHVHMLDAARAAAEAAGYDVVAGYLAPDHDEYVRQKCGIEAVPASVRLSQCAAAVEPLDWLRVDPWAALHRPGAVNYTDVVARLRSYLRAHWDERVDVFYVCGGDNARFASAFLRDAGIIVVSRPSFEAEHTRWRTQLSDRASILFCEASSELSSRQLRNGAWRDLSERRVLLRLEDERVAGVVPVREWRAFQRALVAEFEGFAGVRGARGASDAGVSDAGVSDAGVSDAGVSRGGGALGVISLDVMRPGEHTLALSRLFALGGYQVLGHVARPGSPPLPEQLAAIPSGEYILRDDDSASGGTLRAALAALPPRLRIMRTELTLTTEPGEDVVDSRDFLLGANDAGLVVQLPNGAIGRAPYLLPYVDPAARCNVPPALSRAFSRRLWQLNAEIHATTRLRIRDLPPPVRATFAQHDPERPLAAIAEWHAERIGEG
jgi:nicotinic acid mononucleotide adenylyltransferase